ncbi:hypothetical protein M1N58_01305 [Dehalococcoidales bacterium]|nr:hypothetical protein [Dehalococcoidales bacterium]
MLSSRAEVILKCETVYCPSDSSAVTESELGVSEAIRNEMAYLEPQGYITRCHP